MPRAKSKPIEPRACLECGTMFKPKSNSDPGKFCSKSCRYKIMKGEKAAIWKGGRVVDADGYIRLLKPDHPNAFASGYMHEHRFKMSEHLGRPLEPEEIVHHDDENKSNNEVSNLILTSSSEHTRIHNLRKIK